MTPSSFSNWIDALTQSGLCPFAKPALQSNKVRLINAGNDLVGEIWTVLAEIFPQDQVVLFSFDMLRISLHDIELVVEWANAEFPSFLFLYTHPDMDEPSHPTFGLVFIQHKSEMLQAVEKLKAAGYYANRELPEWLE